MDRENEVKAHEFAKEHPQHVFWLCTEADEAVEPDTTENLESWSGENWKWLIEKTEIPEHLLAPAPKESLHE